MELSNQITNLQEEYAKLLRENKFLKRTIQHHIPDASYNLRTVLVSNGSDPLQKVQLFRDLFKGRTDVFATRWESAEGKQGYSPALRKGKYIPLTDQVFYDHLSGKQTIGIYPLQQNHMCSFLAADFDKNNWKEDTLTFVASCKQAQLPYHIERSRSGNGAHVWIFFSEAISASLARKLGKALLAHAKSQKGIHAFTSFDRLFPSQDSLKENGRLGNLIALPLQRHPREQGNSVFINEDFQPVADQWEYLSTILKVGRNALESALQLVAPSSIPSKTETPSLVVATLKNGIHLRLTDLSDSLLEDLKRLAAFSNPAFYKARAKRLSTHNIPAQIECALQNTTHLILPIGCKQGLQNLMTSRNVGLTLNDERYTGESIDIRFTGALDTQQQDALHSLLSEDAGILSAATGFGKTVTAAALIAERKVNTLIIVNRTQLLKQWMEQLAIFLDIPRQSIGQFGSGKQTPTGIIDVATIQSLTSRGNVHSIITQYGQVIIDECHHLSAVSFEHVMQTVRAKYVCGLTATPKRKDGLHPIITMQCGPVLFQTDSKTQSQIRPYHHVLMERTTNYRTTSETIQQMYAEMAEDKTRNQLIFEDTLSALDEGRTPLILTERVSHVKELANQFKGFVKNIVVLSGRLKKKEREAAFDKISHLQNDEEILIIATGKFIGEGFDFPRLDTLMLVMPISWKGILTQYVGRLHRNHAGKQEVRVYDYIDHNVPALVTMAKKRLKGFHELGYSSLEENRSNADQMRLF